MKRLFLLSAASALLSVTLSSAVYAGPIQRACLSSDRKQRSPSLCSCIQNVADSSLSKSEQRKAAKFFRKPDLAQETRQSSNSANERFWKKYRAFGDRAEQTCG